MFTGLACLNLWTLRLTGGWSGIGLFCINYKKEAPSSKYQKTNKHQIANLKHNEISQTNDLEFEIFDLFAI